MTDVPDYYTILGVGRDATRQEISHAYRALMRSHHPDMDGGQATGKTEAMGDKPAKKGNPGQRDELLRIMQAFNVLRDPGRRADYDRKLAAAAPTIIPVRKVRGTGGVSGHTIRVTPVRWESGPWS
ncbi:DnaJ-class molecular chaperone [Arthrobacter ulcerisalmonis]|uniref:J domain-containing protein n=1 Tax=Arthrobacter sp. B1I2 TaxID=3042263 RepID=UPI00277E593B|nr:MULTISPECIES: J domain-containing protein [Arthrobacter]MDQ0662923.1 DnaJ-class molecular chaperone [Arthrobacter ulcerisalmonis]MDQ0730815.1 DnaJ-class molecular chaperone [Arthrobacter sp. B1I2]